jgi:hypothetical protein
MTPQGKVPYDRLAVTGSMIVQNGQRASEETLRARLV